MQLLTLTLTAMAHGGHALGRDERGRTIFVPGAIPGERVRVEIIEDKGRFAHARLLEVLEPSPNRVAPRCPHFGVCCEAVYQHMAYPAQLRYKQEVVRDQLQRIGGLREANVRPVLPQPEPWHYRAEMTLSPSPTGRPGFWSPSLGQVVPVETCLALRPPLLDLLHDLDIELPGLRKITLRLGDDGALLAALEVTGVEPPILELDFPLSVAIVLPDGTAATLIGDSTIVHSVKGRDFRVSAGSFFYPSPVAAELLADTILKYANLTGKEIVLELYSGVGILTAFLSPLAAEVVAVEANPDSVADAAVNLDDTDNVSVYEGRVEEVLPALDVRPGVIIADPPEGGLPAAIIQGIARLKPQRIVYVSDDPATLARDGRGLAAADYTLVEVQPIDVLPQTFHIHTVSLWQRP